MNCQPIPTDTPGIFRCPVCGLQNPRPIKKPFHAECQARIPPRDLRPLIARLALETGSPEILDDMVRYQSAVLRWEAAGFPVGDSEELKFILETLCPDCRHYRQVTGTCTCCGAKGQLVAVKAWMDTEGCSAMRW